MKKLGFLTVGLVAAAGLAFADNAAEKEATKAGEGGKRHGKRERMSCEDAFKKWDANADGKVTKDEYVAAGEARAKSAGREAPKKEGAEKRFTKMDSNNDGSLTVDEVKGAFEKMKEGRGKRRGVKGGDSKPAVEEKK
ncbi:MAG: hypothetical protein GX608_10670 [Lentisphaerae bacterium]|nr:hypothetical protein [Lentisphaerota bacterium]